MFTVDGVASASVASMEYAQLRDLLALERHTLFHLDSTNASVCKDFVHLATLMPDAAPAEWNQPMPPGTYMLQACFELSAPRAEPHSASASADMQTILIAVLASIFVLATLASVRFGFQFVKNAIDNRTANDANKCKRVRQAVRSVTTMQSSCWLITLDHFRSLGKMVSHEQARDANLLTTVDEYDDLVYLVNNHPVIFFSQCEPPFEPVLAPTCSLVDSWFALLYVSVNGKHARSLILTSSSTTR